MFTLRVTTATALAVTLGAAPTTGWAAARDFKFELVSVKPIGAGRNDVTIRLIHVPDGKPVSGAVIIESKTDMGPSGMAGKWALTLAAKVQGETETVRGAVDYTAAK